MPGAGVKVVALIPARGGSKGIPHKNLQRLGGHPLVAWAIAAAQEVPITEVVVSSDDPGLLRVANQYGAIPLCRPDRYARDMSGDGDVIQHARDVQGWGSDTWVMYLRPTTPLRDPAQLRAALWVLERTPQATALRSVHRAPESPAKWYGATAEGWLAPWDQGLVNAPRQRCPPVWVPNGAVDILRATDWGAKVLGFAVAGLEVDSPAQFDYIRWVHSHTQSPLQGVLDARLAAGPTTFPRSPRIGGGVRRAGS